MNKSNWKLPYIPLLFFKNKFLKNKLINIRTKNAIIPNIFIKKNIKICIFNGIWFLTINNNIIMRNHKFGEFIFTKKIELQTHIKKKMQKSKNKK
jgi:ribosomal protein S19